MLWLWSLLAKHHLLDFWMSPKRRLWCMMAAGLREAKPLLFPNERIQCHRHHTLAGQTAFLSLLNQRPGGSAGARGHEPAQPPLRADQEAPEALPTLEERRLWMKQCQWGVTASWFGCFCLYPSWEYFGAQAWCPPPAAQTFLVGSVCDPGVKHH